MGKHFRPSQSKKYGLFRMGEEPRVLAIRPRPRTTSSRLGFGLRHSLCLLSHELNLRQAITLWVIDTDLAHH